MNRFAKFSALVVLAASALSCGDTTPSVIDQLNLDRPIDIAFACYGGLRILDPSKAPKDQAIEITAQPLEACTIRSGAHPSTEPAPVPAGQEAVADGPTVPVAQWYGFILQSAPGTVALASFATKPSSAFGGADVTVLDADPLTPGKNGISVGEDPIAIATDKVGCFEVVANAGSCDLSAVEISSALDLVGDVRVDRVPIRNAAGETLLARPAAMVADVPGGTIGNSCPANPTGVFYVAYPSCHRVAAVQMTDGPNGAIGKIVAGIDLSGAVPVVTDGNFTCPVECGAGGAVTAGPRPVTLDLEQDRTNSAIRLAIGSENSPAITLVEIGADGLPLSTRQITLEDTINHGDAFGVTAVQIGPQIGMGGNNGSVNDDLSVDQFQFVYAITTDNSIRVADILSVNSECDTQIDPRLIDKVTNVHDLSCFKVGDAATPARRPGAVGPGIRLPVEGGFRDAIPTSLEIFRGDGILPSDPRDEGPSRLIGYFAIVTAASGVTFIIDVDDDDYPDAKSQAAPLEANISLAIAHHLRDAIPQRNLTTTTTVNEVTTHRCDTTGPDPAATTGNIGGTRSTNNPTRNIPTGVISADKVGELPYLRQVLCTGDDATLPVSELAFPAPDAVRDLTYQDLMALRDETWTMTYEGPLSLDTSSTEVDGPSVRVSQIHVDESGLFIEDQAKPFCAAGVEQWDIVQLRGCDPSVGDAQCPLNYKCYVHPNSQISGLGACMLAGEADRLSEACREFLTSSRKYTVSRTASGKLRLEPRRRQLIQSPIDGCVDDGQCKMLADYAVRLASTSHPSQDTSNENTRSYQCLADPDRPPLDGPGQTGKRCLETCESSTDCSIGGICQNNICMEGVIPPQACINAPQRYELRAHDAFTVIGSVSGYEHATIVDPVDGNCIADPAGHPFEVGRIPLSPPACDPTTDPRTGRRPDGTFGPNPCFTTVENTQTVPNYLEGGSCTLAPEPTKIVTQMTDAIEFRNRGLLLHLVDPTYAGDLVCNRDGLGSNVKVPIAFPNYQIAWRQVSGLVPKTLGILPAFPVKVVRGPTESIWVVDAGDYLSTSGAPSTRGKVFRVEVQSAQVNILQ